MARFAKYLNIEDMQQCTSWHSTVKVAGGGNPPRIYLVTLAGPEGRPYCAKESGEQCEANKFGRECKHLRSAMAISCLWHQNYDIHPPYDRDIRQTERQKEKLICPKCKGRTMWIRVAV